MIHTLTSAELIRIAHTTPGNEALVDLLDQLRTLRATFTLRVDLDKLLRKPEQPAGSLPPQ